MPPGLLDSSADLANESAFCLAQDSELSELLSAFASSDTPCLDLGSPSASPSVRPPSPSPYPLSLASELARHSAASPPTANRPATHSPPAQATRPAPAKETVTPPRLTLTLTGPALRSSPPAVLQAAGSPDRRLPPTPTASPLPPSTGAASSSPRPFSPRSLVSAAAAAFGKPAIASPPEQPVASPPKAHGSPGQFTAPAGSGAGTPALGQPAPSPSPDSSPEFDFPAPGGSSTVQATRSRRPSEASKKSLSLNVLPPQHPGLMARTVPGRSLSHRRRVLSYVVPHSAEYQRMALVLGWDKKNIFNDALGLHEGGADHGPPRLRRLAPRLSRRSVDRLSLSRLPLTPLLPPDSPAGSPHLPASPRWLKRSSICSVRRHSSRGRFNQIKLTAGPRLRLGVSHRISLRSKLDLSMDEIPTLAGRSPVSSPTGLTATDGSTVVTAGTVETPPTRTAPTIEWEDPTVFDRVVDDHDRSVVVWSGLRAPGQFRDRPLVYRIAPVRRPSVLGQLRQRVMTPGNQTLAAPRIAARTPARHHRLTLIPPAEANLAHSDPLTPPAPPLLMAAAVERLISKLTTEVDYAYLSDFFLTYREFLSPRDLCRLLFLRFTWATRGDDNDRKLVRIRVFIVLRFWLRNYFLMDFAHSQELRHCFTRHLLEIATSPACHGSAREARMLIELEKIMQELATIHFRDLRVRCQTPILFPSMPIPPQPHMGSIRGRSGASDSPRSPDSVSTSDLEAYTWGLYFSQLGSVLGDAELALSPRGESGLSPTASAGPSTSHRSYLDMFSRLQTFPAQLRRMSRRSDAGETGPPALPLGVAMAPSTSSPSTIPASKVPAAPLRIDTTPSQLQATGLQRIRQNSLRSKRLASCYCKQKHTLPFYTVAHGDATDIMGSFGASVATNRTMGPPMGLRGRADYASQMQPFPQPSTSGNANDGAAKPATLEHYHSNPFDIHFFSRHQPLIPFRARESSFPKRLQYIILGRRTARQRAQRIMRQTALYYGRQRFLAACLERFQGADESDRASVIYPGDRHGVSQQPPAIWEDEMMLLGPGATGDIPRRQTITPARFSVTSARRVSVHPTVTRAPVASIQHYQIGVTGATTAPLTGRGSTLTATVLAGTVQGSTALSPLPPSAASLDYRSTAAKHRASDDTNTSASTSSSTASVDVLATSLAPHPSAPRNWPTGQPLPSYYTGPTPWEDRQRPFILYFRSEHVARQLCIMECEALQHVRWQDLIELRWQKKKVRGGVGLGVGSYAETTESRSSSGSSGRSTGPSTDGTGHSSAATTSTNPPTGPRNQRSGSMRSTAPEAECGVSRVIQRFDRMSQWVVTVIVSTVDAPGRVLVMEKFIRIALKCYYHANFSTLMQILFALQSSPVARLKQTWELLGDYEYEVFQYLRNFACPARNWKNLRDATKVMLECGCGSELGEMRVCPTCSRASLTIENSPATVTEVYERYQIGGCVPFLGLFLSDLVMNAELPTYVKPRPASQMSRSTAGDCSRGGGGDLFHHLGTTATTTTPSTTTTSPLTSSPLNPRKSTSSTSGSSSSASATAATSNSQLVNFHKFRTTAGIIKRLIAFQTILTHRYPFTKNSVLYSLLSDQLEVWDERRVMEQSRELE
ncbi:Guanine nucleotide exchange factor lte1 [Tieghemiomyces parasiticus]|uniref:Guanine nucleotide exchange factor lte1 n=1 Tax=Tieghemiomyces parasiticus TaxID=78921 RepID=A0A9W8A9Q3_9FUNG|nr:Guanine nucleotide exchange factor lte1 [Tieghemiomyces parasiticus]